MRYHVYSIFVVFVFKVVLWANLVWGILLSISVDFVFKIASVAKLVITGVLFSISVGFKLSAAMVTNPVTLSWFNSL